VTIPAQVQARRATTGLRRAQRRAIPFSGDAAVYRLDFPDPYIVRLATFYYAYGTQAGGMNLPALRSADLCNWALIGDVLPRVPAWAAVGRTWSPAAFASGDSHVLYHAVQDAESGRQCIAAEVAPGPEGPFQDAVGRPFVFQRERGGSIDPSVFVDSDGQTYLFWKSDDNALGGVPSLWGQALSPDGLELRGEARELLRHDRVWERPLVEAPAVVMAGGRYYLFYSANWWESERYCIGYAVASRPLGPYSKITRRRPWMVSGPDAAGPGGQEFIRDDHGALWMAYHAWAPGQPGYARGGSRSLRMTRVAFVDGRPIAQSPPASS